MAKYRKGSHTVYEPHYHFVFITKYRKPVLRVDIAKKARELIREICHSEDVEIVKGNVIKDHVHLLLSMPPNISPSRIMWMVKEKSSRHLVREFRKLQQEFLGSHLWARGYFACSTRNVTDEVIKENIELQGKQPQDGPDFKITD